MLVDVIQNISKAEIEDYLGRDKYEKNSKNNNKNYRNGYSKKIILSNFGEKNLKLIYKATTEELMILQLDNLILHKYL